MRFLVALVLTGALAVVGCGDDEANGTGGTGGGTAGTGGAGATGGTGATGGGAGGSGGAGGGGAAPEITNIAWAPVGSCQTNIRSNYTITVTAMDGDLTYEVGVSSCDAVSDDGNEFVISCPNVVAYDGTATVSNSGGNTSGDFRFDVCETSSCLDSPTFDCSL